jgi:hypothetical protein
MTVMPKFIAALGLCLAASAPLAAVRAADAYPDPVSNPSSPLMLAGDWVPTDTAKIDFKTLPVIPGQHSIVHDVRDQDGNRVNQHNYLAFHDGRYWAMWSDGPGQPNVKAVARKGSHRNVMPGHDGIPGPGQEPNKVFGATSTDGLTWSKPFDIAGEPAPKHGWFARGFWIRDGKLLALASQFQPPEFTGPGLSLQAFELLATEPPTWKHAGLVCDDALNNFPPQKLPTGEWMVSRRNGRWETFTMIGGVKAIDDWTQIPIVGTSGKDGFKPDEPIWWALPDGKLAFLFRDNSKGGFLYRAFSTDAGRSWSEPVQTNFPDATSKFSGCRLSDGRYVLASNPRPGALKANPSPGGPRGYPGMRDPMVLSVSADGLVFRQMGVLVAGRHVDYPHVIEHDGHLFVAFASAKQSCEVLKIKLTDLDVLQPVAAR